VDTAPAEDIEEGQNVEVFINLYVWLYLFRYV
jgi:hypothetical protein